MPHPLHLIVQDEITRGIDVSAAAKTLGADLTRIDLTNWRQQAEALDRELSACQARPAIFCSLPVAGYINRACPTLARGVILPKDFLQHAHYSTLLPEDMQLNTGGIYLPWGHIPSRAAHLRSLFAQGIFIRPNSSLKPFTGFAVSHENLLDEHHMMGQAAGIDATEMCLIAPLVQLPEVEYRVWVVDSQPVTAASYGWVDAAEKRPVPSEIIQAARAVAARLEFSEQNFTADFVITDAGIKLVELNATTTSGWYQGMDPKELIQALNLIFI